MSQINKVGLISFLTGLRFIEAEDAVLFGFCLACSIVGVFLFLYTSD